MKRSIPCVAGLVFIFLCRETSLVFAQTGPAGNGGNTSWGGSSGLPPALPNIKFTPNNKASENNPINNGNPVSSDTAQPISQTVSLKSHYNKKLTLSVDGVQAGANAGQTVTAGDHDLTAKDSAGTTVAEENILVGTGVQYVWEITPPPVKLVVKRVKKSSTCILGELYVNDVLFCSTLERPFQNNATGVSAIPVGSYEAIIGSTGKHPEGVIQLQNVKSLVYYNDNGTWKSKVVDRGEGGPIEIHSGNTTNATEGCILVGQPSATDCFVASSVDTLNGLYKQYFDVDEHNRPNPIITVTVSVQPTTDSTVVGLPAANNSNADATPSQNTLDEPSPNPSVGDYLNKSRNSFLDNFNKASGK